MTALDRFGAVSLDDIVARAELLTRVDRKYLVPVADAAAILNRIDPRSRVLEIDGRREFAYDSVYFDTPDHLSYRLTAQRRRRRFKLRTRSYVDTGGTFLELKTKSGRGSTVKDRLACDEADHARITAEGGAHVSRLLGDQGHSPGLVGELRPSIVSRYRRATLLLPGGSRATLDTGLQWACPRSGAALDLPDYAIIESKSAGGATQLDRELWRMGHRPSGISQFGTGTAAMHPELPDNKWARVLRGPFSAAIRSSGTGAPARRSPAISQP
jgi:hypothetical protein